MSPFEITCTGIGTGICGIAFYCMYLKEPRENKKFLIEKFEFGNKVTVQLYNDLVRYVVAHSCGSEHFMQGFSFDAALRVLETAMEEIFTHSNRELLQKKRIAKIRLEEFIKRIDIHTEGTISAQTHFNMNFTDRLQKISL